MEEAEERPWASYPLREHRRQMAELEAAGRDLWVEELDQPTRNKLAAATRKAIYDPRTDHDVDALVQNVARVVCEEAGEAELPHVFVNRYGNVNIDRFLNNISDLGTPQALIFGLIEYLWRFEAAYSGAVHRRHESQAAYGRAIKTILEDHRVKHIFVNGNFLPRDGSLMDTEVVVPALHFLIGDERFADAEKAYVKALKAIGENRPDDAISQVYTALQSLLQSLGCGKRQDTLKRQLQTAVNEGILAPHDQALDGWLTSDRGNRSSSHPASAPPTRDDAWLAVHVIGALMLRLGRGAPRAGAN